MGRRGKALVGRRGKALVIAALAIGGLLWAAQQLRAAGQPLLPVGLLGPIAVPVQQAAANVALTAQRAQLLLATLAADLLQFAVLGLALLALIALVIALRPARQPRPAAITIIKPAEQPRPASPTAAPRQRCPACGESVRADWAACPRCAAALPATSRAG